MVPLLLALWRDGVALSKKSSIYPVCCMLMNVAEQLRSARANMSRLGLTAAVGGAEAYHYASGTPLSVDHHRDLVAYSTHLSMDLILEQFWVLCETGFYCYVHLNGPDRPATWALVVPYCARFVAGVCVSACTASMHFFLYTDEKRRGDRNQTVSLSVCAQSRQGRQ